MARTSQIVRSRRLGPDTYAAPETLAVINASGNASNPFIAPDESYLIFAAERPEGRGDSDLYVAWREGESWSAPRNLGPRVNTALSEFASSVSPDGRTLYFTRMSRGEWPPVKEENIMSIRLSALGFPREPGLGSESVDVRL